MTENSDTNSSWEACCIFTNWLCSVCVRCLKLNGSDMFPRTVDTVLAINQGTFIGTSSDCIPLEAELLIVSLMLR